MFNVRTFEARTLSWWATQRDVIDFNPPYQRRGGLWSRSDKAFLIDSIINRYDVPKLYIADFTFGLASSLNANNRQYAVIDGKQRYEAIFDFIDGKITLRRDFVWTDDPSLELGGLGYSDLRTNYPKVAAQFDNFNLTVMAVVTDEEGRINELFVRLNRNKTLTGPEIRNAMKGVVPELTRKIAADTFFQEKVKFDTARGQDLDVAAKFLLVEFRGQLTETKRGMLDRLVEEGISADANVADLERASLRVVENLQHMNQIFLPKDPLLATQGPMVPYYWLIRAISPSQHHRVRPFLVVFEKLRETNRKMALDPANNSSVNPTLLAYDRYNRSINDLASIEGRFRILLDAFKRFAQNPAISTS
jgi:hypothetical protein